jgi:uncharacterized protein DUF3168
MKVIRTGIRQSLIADSEIQTLVGDRVYHRLGPDDATLPYIVIQQQSGNAVYAFSGRVARQTMWLVKALAVTMGSAEDIDEAIDRVLTDGALDVSPYRLLECRRDSDISMPERDGGTTVHHVGALYRISLTKDS